MEGRQVHLLYLSKGEIECDSEVGSKYFAYVCKKMKNKEDSVVCMCYRPHGHRESKDEKLLNQMLRIQTPWVRSKAALPLMVRWSFSPPPWG